MWLYGWASIDFHLYFWPGAPRHSVETKAPGLDRGGQLVFDDRDFVCVCEERLQVWIVCLAVICKHIYTCNIYIMFCWIFYLHTLQIIFHNNNKIICNMPFMPSIVIYVTLCALFYNTLYYDNDNEEIQNQIERRGLRGHCIAHLRNRSNVLDFPRQSPNHWR